MNIAWFTPFHKKSAIGQVSKLVCETLHKSCGIKIFTMERGEEILTTVPVVKFAGPTFGVHKLDAYDYVVYNMGNFAGNHKDIWDVMQRYPGIVVLHDQLMQQFFVQINLLAEYGGNSVTFEKSYLDLMKTCYGPRGEIAGRSEYQSYFGEAKVKLWDSESALSYPLLDPILKKSTAVFSHAAFFLEKLKDSFFGPMGFAYLPYIKTLEYTHASLTNELLDGTRALVVSAGIVHPVKRIHRVAEMLLKNPDIAAKVRYVVIGEYGGEFGEYLLDLSRGKLNGCLYLLGYQPDNVMNAFLQKADFCINLRFPNSEVCSKSLIEQMAYKNPVIVLNSGIFSELPDDCVVKINLENEIPDLEKWFRLLLSNKELGYEIGRKAAQFVESNCTTENYIQRFKNFLLTIPEKVEQNYLVNESLETTRRIISDLGFNEENVPATINATWHQLNKLFSASSREGAQKEVLGIWLGFPYVVGLRREGITKFLFYMLSALLQRYSLECEIWTYSFNEEEVRLSFEPLIKDHLFYKRIKIVTEKNYRDVLDIPAYERNLSLEINENIDNLAGLAKEYSEAACFVTAIVYLDNVIGTGRHIFVPVHDLGIHSHYESFVAKDPLYKARFVDIRSRAENFARSGAFMFSNSEYIRREQVLRHVYGLSKTQTDVVYLPVNIPKNINENLISEKNIRDKYKLKRQYIFYPTQIRPYKNVRVLVEALSILRGRDQDIDLVLTGNPSDVPEVDLAINNLNLKGVVSCLSDVTEYELYSLYRYAALSAVPTLFEGGFPWQACEALFMDTPLVLSNIPVVRERIQFMGMEPENCGIILFDPENPEELALAMEQVLLDRDKALSAQMNFKEKLLSYSWNDAAEKYYNLFFTNQSRY